MRPLVHPAIEDVTVAAILHALADPARVAIFANITSASCAQACTAFAHISNKEIPKSTLSEHFKVLREAGLIRSERSGVEMQNTSRMGELEGRFPGLLPAIIGAHKKQLEDQAKAAKKKLKRA